MDSEIQILKEQIEGLKESLPERNVDTFEDKLTEISNDEQSKYTKPSIYLLGGHDGCSWLGTLDAYLPETNNVRCIAEVPTTRSYAAATILDGSIYIFGGGNGILWHNSGMQYNPFNISIFPMFLIICRKIRGIFDLYLKTNEVYYVNGSPFPCCIIQDFLMIL